MSRSGRNNWRRVAAAAALVAVLVFGLGFVLRAAGLGAAANTAQLVSLAPIAVSVINWSRAKSSEKEDPGLDQPGTVLPGAMMLWIAAGLLCVVVIALILQIWDLAPQVPRRAVDWAAGTAGLASCVAFVVYWALIRRQPIPLSSSLRTLLEQQRDLAQRHQYVYSDGTAPPIGKIYVDQWTDWLMQKSATGLPAMSLSLPDMVRGSRNAIILADPGVGKSTAMAQVIGYQSEWWLNAKRFMKPDDAPYGPVMPVMLPADLHRCDNLSAAMARQWTELTGARVDARAFERKPPYANAWLVLIDGIDQIISTKDRVGLLVRLSAWTADEVSPVRFLLTSRPLPSSELGPLRVEYVGRYRLKKFDIEGLNRFVEQWATFRAGQNLPEVDLQPITAEEFMAAIRAAKLVSLAQVPLVATITALILESGRETELPTGRAELYERFIAYLFSSRRLELLGDEIPDQWRPYGRNGRRAWRWLLDNLRDILEGAAHRHLSVNPPGVVVCAKQWADNNAPAGMFAGLPDWGNVLKGLLTATSLVVPRPTGLEFTHPNIEEYLAAGPRGREFNAETWLADVRSRDSRSLALFVLARTPTRSAPGEQGLADQLAERILERGGAELCIAGAIIADGIEVTASIRTRVLDGLVDLLVEDGADISEVLDTLITLVGRDDVLRRLTMFVEDATRPAWVRADIADELCGLSRDTGLRLLRVVLGGIHDSLLRDRILSKLEASGDLRDGERESAADTEAASTIASEGNWAGRWYRQIAQDSNAETSHRLRALLAMAERSDPGWTPMLANIITAPSLPDDVRRDAAWRIGQLADRNGVEVLRRVAGQQELGLKVRVPLLAGLADAQDEDSRQALSKLATAGGVSFHQRFPWVVTRQLEAVPRSSEQSAEPITVYPEGSHETPSIFGHVPPRNVNFTGRQEILHRLGQEMLHAATTRTSGGSRHVLEGLGGIGKTSIAIEYAHRYRSFYDLVWWVNAEERASIATALASLAGQLGTEAAGVTGTEQAAESAVDALRRGEPFPRWLLIFDNANRPEDLTAYLPDGPGDILITSRYRDWESPAQVRDVDVFSRSESRLFLAKRMGREVSGPGPDLLASKLGDLPLALDHAGAFLTQTGMKLDEYTSLLDEQMARLLGGDEPPGNPVKGAYDLSVSSLRQQSPEAIELLRYCSFFAPEPIPRDVLRSPAPRSGIEPLVADPVLLAQLIRELGRLALMTVNIRTVSVHRLVQELVRDGISADDQAAYRHEAQLMLAFAVPPNPDDDRSWPRYRDLLPHVTAPALELERSREAGVRDCALKVLRYLNASGDAASCREHAERFIGQWVADSGPDDPDVLNAQRHLGDALRLLGQDTDADRLAEATLNRAREVLGEHAPLTRALQGAIASGMLLALSAAVVKMAFRLWIGDDALADDMSASLTDLIKRRVSSTLEQRRVHRQFEEIEDLLVERLRAMLDPEFRGLQEGEKNAAILAVTETFNRVQLTDRALFDADLDPLYLTSAVRRFIGNAAHDLSQDGIMLYDRLLTQCCSYTIEIAGTLPRFQASAVTELLRRDKQILARIEEVLERLPVPVGDGARADQFETAYRQFVAKRFDRLELLGLDFMSPGYPLSVAYVDPNVSVQRGVGEQLEDQGTETTEHWLDACPRLLINGSAGSGKTTMLQWISVRAALRDFAGPAVTLNGCVPFLLRLREYAGQALPRPEEFLDKVAPLLAPEAPQGWTHERLRSGKAFVLLDGLDEIPESERPTVLRWLEELTVTFPLARYVATSTPGTIAPGALGDAGFVTATLEPMDPGLIRVFIDQWHAAMREWQKDIQEAERLETCRDELLRALDDDKLLSELASTPVHAALICALNLQLDARLPRRHGEILEQALALFYRRDRERLIRGAVALDLDETIHLLSDLALWMVRNERSEVSADEAASVAADSARDLLRRSVRSLPTQPLEADVYSHLLSRTGVLREPTAGQIQFVHRTFQEYLAARALIMSDSVGELIANADASHWREVIILASGQGNSRQTSELLRGLLRSTSPSSDRYRRLLAVACLNEIRAADPSVLADIDRAILDLLPPRSLAQAEAFSHAGERLITHLARIKSFHDPDELLAVIRTAALIGGSSALDVIARIASRHEMNDPRLPAWPILRGEYMRSWQYFTGTRYVERVLLPAGVLDLEVNNPRLLADLVGLPTGIESITLHGSLGDQLDLSAISGGDLRDLRIISCDARIIGSRQPWTSVKRLRLEALGKLVDVPAVRLLPNLEILEIINCEKLADYAPLAKLVNLRTIHFEGCMAGDVGKIARLPKLKRIAIRGMHEVDLEPFAERNFEITVDKTIVIAPLPTIFRPTIRRT